MDRDLLSHLPIIICVAPHRSFAAAATELGMSPSAVSHAVRSVEDRLGTLLFARTTRSVPGRDLLPASNLRSLILARQSKG